MTASHSHFLQNILTPLAKTTLLAIPLLTLTCHNAYAHSIDVYAHRGYRAIAPENTLLAYRDALKIGVDVIDADINLTKDKVLVVTHDLSLNKDITKDQNDHWITKSIPIKDLTLKQLETYDVGSIKPNTALAKLYSNHQNISKVEIPTLEEVINYLKSTTGKRVRLQIEIKTDPSLPDISSRAEDMAIAVNKILTKTHMVDQTEVQAYEWKALIQLQKLNPKIKTAYLTDHTVNPMTAEQAASLPQSKLWTAPFNAADYNYDYPKMVAEAGGSFWEPYQQDLSQEDLNKAHQLGLKVVVWGWAENDETDFNYSLMNKLIAWGVDGIITDRPDILRGIEAANGLIPPPSYVSAP
jgi:glycerophosphoryl diester phosphodiesterase